MKGKQFVNFMAYLAIALIATALILAKVLSALKVTGTVVTAMNMVAQIIAYTITAVFGFFYAKSKRNIGWMIAYIVFVIAIIVFFILGL